MNQQNLEKHDKASSNSSKTKVVIGWILAIFFGITFILSLIRLINDPTMSDFFDRGGIGSVVGYFLPLGLCGLGIYLIKSGQRK